MQKTVFNWIFHIWTATSRPIRPMVFIYLNWWGMVGFAHQSWTLQTGSVEFLRVFVGKDSNLRYSSTRLLNSPNATVETWVNMARHDENYDQQSKVNKYQHILCKNFFLGCISSLFLNSNPPTPIAYVRLDTVARTSFLMGECACLFSWRVRIFIL